MAANANTFISSTSYLDYELPKSVLSQCAAKDNCPEIEIRYLDSNQAWMNSLVNSRINNIIINSQPSDSPVSDLTTKEAAITAIDNLAKSQFSQAPQGTSWAYSLTVKPEYLGHIKLGDVKSSQPEDLELFEIKAYVFTGGAHGMSFSEYLIFDPSTKKRLQLADVLQTKQMPRFKDLAYHAYKAWIKTVDNGDANYEKNWPFTLSENVTLTDKGIDIRYPLYAIAPYAYGMPVLSIPYTKLNGVIKPRFLPSL